MAFESLQHLVAIHVGQADIDESKLWLEALCQIDGVKRVGGAFDPVAGRAQDLGHGPRALGHPAPVAGVTGVPVGHRAHAHRVVVAAGEECGPRWGAKRGRVEPVVAQATIGQALGGNGAHEDGQQAVVRRHGDDGEEAGHAPLAVGGGTGETHTHALGAAENMRHEKIVPLQKFPQQIGQPRVVFQHQHPPGVRFDQVVRNLVGLFRRIDHVLVLKTPSSHHRAAAAWCARRGSNPQPTAPEAVTLSN